MQAYVKGVTHFSPGGTHDDYDVRLSGLFSDSIKTGEQNSTYSSTHRLDLRSFFLESGSYDDDVGGLVRSPIGFYHFVEVDQKILSLQHWSTRTLKEFCRADGKGRHYGIDQAGVWVDCGMRKRR
jgi:hypothetical protein